MDEGSVWIGESFEEPFFHTIDFSKVPGGIISGLTTEELNKVADASMSINDTLICDAAASKNAASSSNVLSEEILSDLDQLDASMRNKSTASQTTRHVKLFKNFLTEKKLPTSIETMNLSELSSCLRYFYSSLRTSRGEFYAPTTLLGIRASISRYLS